MLDRTASALADDSLLPGSETIEAPGPSENARHTSIWIAEREEWKLANRIVASRGFRKSELLQKFLLEICELTLAGDARSITEQYIGHHIFGRPEGYDPGEDNIVRSYARMLRRRLDAYFDDEGAHELLRLSVPRGGYIPEFSAVQSDHNLVLPSEQEDNPATVPQEPQAIERAERARLKWAAAGAATGALAMVLIWLLLASLQSHKNASAAHVLWTQLFDKKHRTVIVAADSGLGMVENLTHTEATLDRYASGKYLAESRVPTEMDEANFADVSRQHYTSAVDLSISTAFMRLPEFAADRTEIRFARDLTVQEMQNSNVILLGSTHSNPWVALFEPRLNFKFVYTPQVDRSYIVNRRPQAGEEQTYANGSADGGSPTYGIVAYLPDAGGIAHVLVIEGLNMAGTQAAANILFDSTAMQRVLQAAAMPGGRLRAFELLIETTSVGPSAPAARIIATHIYPEA